MTSHSISRSLSYNEEKVGLGKAECLAAVNFLKSLPRLMPEDKLRCFQRRMDLNDRVRTSLHITLNFDPSDKLSNEQMRQIAALYMKDIGFEKQPYLVYRHHDAGHPHCHIVTTHIRSDGNPIDLFNIGRNQSEKARQHIEAEFGLVTGEMKRQTWLEAQKIDGIQRIKYGEKSITRSISRVVSHVIENYKFTSLDELNTILRLYNVEAYRGKENSQLYLHRGLLYRVLDDNGKYIGVPIKASFFDFKPTLPNLEKRFAQNRLLLENKERSRQRLTTLVRFHLLEKSADLNELVKRLAAEQISMRPMLDSAGVCRQVSYIDFRNQCIFSGTELDEYCNAGAIRNFIDRGKALTAAQRPEKLEQVQKRKYSLHL